MFIGCDKIEFPDVEDEILDDYEEGGGKMFGGIFNEELMKIAFLKSWMGELDDETLLSDISIPGTHDSGTQLIPSNMGNMHTQNFSIRQQLDDGIRFLDIRLQNERTPFLVKTGKLQVYHGTYNCYILFDQVLVWCKNFLDKYPSEVILMSIKNEEGDDILNNLFHYFDDTRWKNLFYDGNDFDKRIPTLGEVRGRIVVYSRTNYTRMTTNFIDWYTGWDMVSDKSRILEFKNPNRWEDQSFTYYIADEYEQYDTRKKWPNVQEHLLRAANGRKEDFYLTFISISHHGQTFTPYHYAWGTSDNTVNPIMNSSLRDFMSLYNTCFVFNTIGEAKEIPNFIDLFRLIGSATSVQEGVGKPIRWGVIMLDYYNNHGNPGENELVENIIRSNKLIW